MTFHFVYSLHMNNLAVELNQVLEGTTALELLSDFGKRFFFPKGIAAQAAESKAKAKKFNATIGMAYADKEPTLVLTLLRGHLPWLRGTSEDGNYLTNDSR